MRQSIWILYISEFLSGWYCYPALYKWFKNTNKQKARGMGKVVERFWTQQRIWIQHISCIQIAFTAQWGELSKATLTKWNDFHCFFCAYSATSSWKPPISLFLPVLSFCRPEPWFYLQVTFYRKVFPCYCLEVVYFLSQGYLHFNGATYPCVRIATVGRC